MREDLSPQGAVEGLYVAEEAIISKQRDEAIGNWDQRRPYPLAINRWISEPNHKKISATSVQSIPDKITDSDVQPGDSSPKYLPGSPVESVDSYIIWLMILRSVVRELTIYKPLSSSAACGMECLVAQRMGVDVENSIGSKPDSNLYVDCSPEQIQDVIDAACALKQRPRLGILGRCLGRR